MIEACLNGSYSPGEHQGLPVATSELAAEARRCTAAGAAASHFHPRDPDAELVRAAVEFRE